ARSCGMLVASLSLFFFSSRRRHTRLVSDWSSDVCSSDLPGAQPVVGADQLEGQRAGRVEAAGDRGPVLDRDVPGRDRAGRLQDGGGQGRAGLADGERLGGDGGRGGGVGVPAGGRERVGGGGGRAVGGRRRGEEDGGRQR